MVISPVCSTIDGKQVHMHIQQLFGTLGAALGSCRASADASLAESMAVVTLSADQYGRQKVGDRAQERDSPWHPPVIL